MALVLQVFSHGDRVKAMGWWALVGAGGPVLGVTIGAPIIQYFGWRALFWGELPLMAVAAVLAVIVLPSGDRSLGMAGSAGATDPAPDTSTAVPSGSAVVPSGTTAGPSTGDAAGPTRPSGPWWGQLDWLGSLTLSTSVTALLLALNVGPSWGFAAPPTLGVFAVSILSGVAFVLHERRAPHPLIPLRYFRMRNFVFPLGARTFVNFSYMGGFFLFPILVERVYGYSETRAGLVSTARPLMFSIVAPIAGYAAVKVGERLSTVAGAVALLLSMLVFTQLGPRPSLVVILVALAMSGVGNGLSTPSTASSASNEVAPDELGVMSAAQQLITQIGIVAGIQVMVTVQASSHGGVGSLASFHRAYAVGAVGAVLAGVFGLFMRNTPGHGRKAAVTEADVAGRWPIDQAD
jgi:MFS family permease